MIPDAPDVRAVDADDFDWASGGGVAADVRRINESADAADEAVNLNEAACLHLKYRGLEASTLHVAPADDPAGYALLYDGTLDLVVHPDARGRGVGTTLATAALAGVRREVDAWSHSDHPAAARIAARTGLRRERELWVMERPLDDTLQPAEAGADYRVRTFRTGDEEALLAVNASAFAHHPEQGHMTLADFRERVGESWFDAEGLFLAVPLDEEDADPERRVLGFHWTKVHPEGYGEVYVVAVNPKAAGRGIGKVLTNAGLLHLRDLGLPRVILYVDGDNAPAIAVYDGAGFRQVRTEAQYVGVPDQ